MIHRPLLAALLLAAAPAAAQEKERSPVEDIASQPLRDLGIMRTDVADVLQKAVDSTYSLSGLKTCAQLRAAVRELDGVLGSDWDRRAPADIEDPTEQIAHAGLRAGVGALIPFRGVVREVTGSAAAERRLRVAVQAGQARRGYLRGVIGNRGCR
jgi:hypothetical protein